MRGVEEILIPARFLLTTGHFISVIMSVFNMAANISANFTSGGYSESAYNTQYNSLTAAITLSLLAHVIQYVGLFGGWTMFRNQLNAFHCLFHFFGGVLTCWYLLAAWASSTFWCVGTKSGCTMWAACEHTGSAFHPFPFSL
jgi:hypothetical protein